MPKLLGVGINDADYAVYPLIDGKQVMCPFYRTWRDMLRRCYSEVFLIEHPTYVGCSVTSEWHPFMTFKAWMEAQEWEHNVLDKDILIPNNKVYSPQTCIFVPQWLNNLLLSGARGRGKYPQGVSLDYGRYKAGCSIKGKLKNLGRYSTPEEASKVYKEFKSALILKEAETYPDTRVTEGLKLHAALILKGD